MAFGNKLGMLGGSWPVLQGRNEIMYLRMMKKHFKSRRNDH